MEIEPLVASIATTMRMLGGCSDQHVRNLIDQGKLVSFLDGRMRKITVESIKAYIAERIAAGEKGKEPQNGAAGRAGGLKKRRELTATKAVAEAQS